MANQVCACETGARDVTVTARLTAWHGDSVLLYVEMESFHTGGRASSSCFALQFCICVAILLYKVVLPALINQSKRIYIAPYVRYVTVNQKRMLGCTRQSVYICQTVLNSVSQVTEAASSLQTSCFSKFQRFCVGVLWWPDLAWSNLCRNRQKAEVFILCKICEMVSSSVDHDW